MVYLEKVFSKIKCPELTSYVVACCCLLNDKEKVPRYYMLVEKDKNVESCLTDEQK